MKELNSIDETVQYLHNKEKQIPQIKAIIKSLKIDLHEYKAGRVNLDEIHEKVNSYQGIVEDLRADIIDYIEYGNEKINLSNVVINNELDLGYLLEALGYCNKDGYYELNKIITFKNSIFKHEVQASNIIFHKEISFDQACFKWHVFFYNLIFKEEVSCIGTNFKEKISFINSIFDSRLNFLCSVFNEIVYFYNNKFNEINCSGTSFKKDLSISYSSCKDDFDIHGANIYGAINLNKSIFEGKFNFTYVTINGEYIDNDCIYNNADYSCSIFEEKVNINSVEYSGRLYFIDTRFISNVNFHNANFNDNISFQSSIKQKDQKNCSFRENISFYGCKFHRELLFRDVIFIKLARFRGCQFIDKAKFENLETTNETVLDFENSIVDNLFLMGSTDLNANINVCNNLHFNGFRTTLNSVTRIRDINSKGNQGGCLDFSDSIIGGVLDIQKVYVEEFKLKGVVVPGNITQSDLYYSEEFVDRETFRLLKNETLKSNDVISSLEYKSKEMNAFIKELSPLNFKEEASMHISTKIFLMISLVIYISLFSYLFTHLPSSLNIENIVILLILLFFIAKSFQSICHKWEKIDRIFRLIRMNDFSNRVPLILNLISNNHGIDWIRGVGFTLVVAFLFSLALSCVDDAIVLDLSFNGCVNAITNFVKLINLAEWKDLPFSKTGLCYPLLFIGRMFIGYGYYQTAQAFRKYGKK